MTVIEVSELTKRYGRRLALDGVSFTVEAGEIFGVLGPNGAGKTTTVECVAGLRSPDSGRLRVLGVDPRRDRAAVRRQVGVQLQHTHLPEQLTVAEALRLFSSFHPNPIGWRELLDALGLADKANTRFGRLSGGQRQRLSIALALVGGPRIAVLDELTTGLDPVARRTTWDLIEAMRDRGTTILLVTHFMPEAGQLCDRIAVIDGGRLTALGTPGEIVNHAGGAQRIRFRPLTDFDPSVIAGLPEVSSIDRRGDEVIVSGRHADLVGAVTGALSRAGIVAGALRVEQPSLDDAFVALTTRDPAEIAEIAEIADRPSAGAGRGAQAR
jgi:ABC-2 type transport system ATP-binding protein